MNRREFTKIAAASSLGLAANKLNLFAAEPQAKQTSDLTVHLFSKHLQFLDYRDMAKAAAEMGFDGLDLTVRPRGHVEPEHVKRDLPKAVDAMRNEGLEPLMMASGINNPDDPVNVQVLETAARLGFKIYRLAYYRFGDAPTWKQSMDGKKVQFDALGRLNQALGLHGAYQNHSGTHLGAYLPDIAYLLEGADPRWLGCQYDIRHATVEGGTAWPLGLRWVQNHIQTIAIKDFRWERIDGRHRPIHVPLGTGVVDFVDYFRMLRSFGIQPELSLHLEYDLGGAEHGKREVSIPAKDVYAAMEADLAKLKELWQASA
jgi:sugar phosphate isomerase/epimerase